MWLDGMQFFPNPKIGVRSADPERDRDLAGRPFPVGTLVFVYLQDGRIVKENGQIRIDLTRAPAIPMNAVGEGRGVGPWRKRRSVYGVMIGGRLYHEYEQRTIYLAYNGRVYTASQRRPVSAMRQVS